VQREAQFRLGVTERIIEGIRTGNFPLTWGAPTCFTVRSVSSEQGAAFVAKRT
jgi:hypothetical protein